MYMMQVHARTEWVNVPDLERMLHKVRWALGEVSLYASPVKKEKIDGKHPRPPGAPRKGKQWDFAIGKFDERKTTAPPP